MFRALLLLGCFALAAPAMAQNCNRALERAETSYQAGEFDSTIDRLTTCIEAGQFSDEERRKAYRLIGLSYIGKDREADARAAVAALLDVAPNYEPDPALDPPPFVRMVAEMRRQRPGRTLPGAAIASTRKGFNASFRGHGASFSDDIDSEASLNGGGGDLTLGYALSPALSVYTNLSGSSVSNGTFTAALGGVSLGGRYHVNGGKAKVVPFVGAAASFQAASFTSSGSSAQDFSGAGGELEGGVLYFFSPTLALDAGLSAAFATITEENNSDNTVAAAIVRIGVGLSWRP